MKREDLLEAVRQDAELMQYLLIVNNNNYTLEEAKKGKAKPYTDGAFNVLTLDDYSFLDYSINKAKNYDEEASNKAIEEQLEIRREEIERETGKTPTEEEIEEAREQLREIAIVENGVYKMSLNYLKEDLSLKFIARSLKTYLDLAYFQNLVFIRNFSEVFVAIDVYKGKPIAIDLRKFLRDLIRVKGKDPLRFRAKEISVFLSDAEIEDYSYYFHLCIVGKQLKQLALANSKGKVLARTKKEMLKGNDDIATLEEESIEDFIKQLENTTDENFKGLTPGEVVAKLKGIIKGYINYAEKQDETGFYFVAFLNDLTKKYNLDFFCIEDKGEINNPRIYGKKIEELDKKAKENLTKLDAKKLLESTEENTFIKEVVKAFSSKEYLDELLEEDKKDDINLLEDIEDPRAYRTRSIEVLENNEDIIEIEAPTQVVQDATPQKNVEITDEELKQAKLNKWTKTNVSPLNTDIKTASLRVVNFREKPLASKIRRLKELEDLEEPNKEEVAEMLELKKEVEESIQEKEKLEEKIARNKEDIEELSKDYLEETDVKEKKELGKLIKKIEKEQTKLTTTIAEKYTKDNLYLSLVQDLETGDELIQSEEGGLTLTINNSGLGKYNAEVERLIYYIETLFYYTLDEDKDKYYFIDIDDYAERTGRVVTTKLKHKIEDALEVLQKEKITIKREYKGYDIRGKIGRVGDFFTLEPKGSYEGVENTTRKTGYVITLEKTFRDILWRNKASYWASIPNAVMKLQNPLTRGLGFYLYETLKKGVKETGYYIRKFNLSTIVEKLTSRGLLATNSTNKYSKRVIEPLRNAFNELKDIGLITFDEDNEDNAFNYYDAHLVGTKNLERTFEQKSITIKFLVYDKAVYDKILETNKRNLIENKKRKTRAKNRKKAEESN